MKYILYIRVSTKKQSTLSYQGFGMKSQRDTAYRMLRSDDEIVDEYIEVESGSSDTRPQLAAACLRCKNEGYTLLIARLDRLARNVAFTSKLIESGVKFICADMPMADEFTIHIISAVAEKERKNISDNSKRTWAMVKMYGTKSGKKYEAYKPTPEQLELMHRRKYQEDLFRTFSNPMVRMSYALIESIRPASKDVYMERYQSFRSITATLNESGYTDEKGLPWTEFKVRRIYHGMKSKKVLKILEEREAYILGVREQMDKVAELDRAKLMETIKTG